MLFKKTLKVASAAALWMVALLGANSAMAQDDPPTFSAETLAASATGMYAVASDMIKTRVKLDGRTAYLLAEGRGVEIRVEGTGVLRLSAAPTVQLVTQTPAVGATPAGPLTLDGSPATAVGALPAGNAWRHDFGTTAVANAVMVEVVAATASVTGLGDGDIRVRTYSGTDNDRQDDAHFGEGTAHTDASGTALMVARSAVVKAAAGSPSMLTASAAHRFKQFINASGTVVSPVSFGGFDIQIDDKHLNVAGTSLRVASVDETDDTFDPTAGVDPTDEQVAAGRAALFGLVGIGATAGARFYGDGGFGFAKSFQLRSNADCGAGTGEAKPAGAIKKSPVAEDEDDQSDDVQTAVAIEPWYLCVTVDDENDAAIAQGDYMMDVTIPVAAGDLRPFPAMGATGVTVARVGHDGTTVQIPYVTSYEGYTQRIVIVNRGKADVNFSLEFRAEDDGMIMASGSDMAQLTHDEGTTFSGMAMGEQATVIKVADEVTLMNPTRASATLVLEAPPSVIDAATTMVNKMDQSTDTVVLESR